MRKVLLDLNPARSVEWIHEYLKFELEFGDHYGCNLDALYDCLTDVREEAEIRIVHRDALRENLEGYASVLERVLQEAAEENPRLMIDSK